VHIMQRFNLEQLCSSIEANRITVAYLVPPVILLLAKSPAVDKYDLSSLRLMHSAAAPLSNDLIGMVYKSPKHHLGLAVRYIRLPSCFSLT
jgi:4-coumarate--CoA ligase